ncbi:hypothetical protein A2U01_0062465, partial [Trifolium medium]|nr:hypothetical protein [Trifolium medium]
MDPDPGIANVANKNPVSTRPDARVTNKTLIVTGVSTAGVTQGDVNQQADKVITDTDDSQEFQVVVSKFAKKTQK